MVIVGCPVCPNRKETERTTEINQILVDQHKRFRKKVFIFAILLPMFQAAFLYSYQWLRAETERHSKEICYQLTNSDKVVYYDDKCYLPDIAGDLSFIVDLSKLGYERTRIRLLD